MNFPEELKYTRDHEWVRREDGFAVVGITGHAQEKLGSIVFVELPPPAKSFRRGEVLATVDSVKTVAEVYAPVGGEVEAVNEALREKPEAINQSPYEEGWMVRLKVDDPAELEALLSAEVYAALIREEEAKE
ncbi:MAG: glycine cleavage system protein GcvH [Deltaproteobacteria bacterium]|nr:glycine cleavage system protein GcvH [Deltaproteobacteria bacterium]